jgi:hypothetical protein
VSIFRQIQTRFRTPSGNDIVSFVSFHLCSFHSFHSKPFVFFESMKRQNGTKPNSGFSCQYSGKFKLVSGRLLEMISFYSYRFISSLSFYSSLCRKMELGKLQKINYSTSTTCLGDSKCTIMVPVSLAALPRLLSQLYTIDPADAIEAWDKRCCSSSPFKRFK